MNTQNVTRIELVWPEKGLTPYQDEAGRWHAAQSTGESSVYSIMSKGRFPPEFPESARSLAMFGNRLDALVAVRRIVRRSVQLVYADVPRIEGFDETRAFLSTDGRTFSVWLSMVREHVRAAARLLSRQGVFAAQVGDLEAPFVRMILSEALGPQNYLGTALWRTHYSPKGGKDSNEIAPIHENIICFAFDKEAITKVALPVLPEGYANPDGDPRGDWEARQKDAGRDTVKLTYNVPPYRWSLIEGRLPKGLWRLSPMSGVIWGEPEESGIFRIKVRVEDSAGKSSEKQLRLEILDEGGADTRPGHVWWMLTPPKATKSAPRITTDALPRGYKGKQYSEILAAAGGAPFAGTPRPGRGWAFGQATLETAIIEDRCSFGKKGTAIPETKKYIGHLEGGVKLVNLTSWWDDVALSQDSTKHQNALLEAGLIQLPVVTAKPELLLDRLVSAFAPKGSLILEMFCRSGDLAAVALKTGRDFVALMGSSKLDREYATKCALPRLEAVIQGEELARLLTLESSSADRRSEFLPLQGRGAYEILDLGPAVATRLSGDEQAQLSIDVFKNDKDLMEGVLTSEGFLIAPQDGGWIRGKSWDGAREAVILEPRTFLDQTTAAEFASTAPSSATLAVYYFRSADDFAPEQMQGQVSFRRIPSELTP